MIKLFNPRHILRHLSANGIQAIFDYLQIDHTDIDWSLGPKQLNPLLQQFYDQLEGSVQHTLLDAFRRVFNMADNKGITAIKQASKYDAELNDQILKKDTDYDRVLFVLINHSDLFREAEKLYEFWGRQNGASYKRHQIMGEFNLNDSLFDQKELGKVVGEILKKEGANGQCHVEHKYQSCYTAVHGDFVFEGHIPAKFIQQFLDNPPSGATGLAVPAMPLGSPGMEMGERFTPYTIVQLNSDGKHTVFAEVSRMEDQY